MKKLDKTIYRKYPPVVLYLEDLEEIERVLRDNALAFSISYGNYQYDSVSELVGAVGAKQIRDVRLRARDSYTSVDLDRNLTSAFVSADDNKAASVFYQLEEIILRCRRLFPWLYKAYLPSVSFVLVGLLSAGLEPLFAQHGFTLKYYIWALPIVLFIWVYWIIFQRNSTVCLFKKPGSFIARNHDQLILSVVSVWLVLSGVIC